MSTEWNDLERRLRELGSDIGGVPLPGPDAARHRARQRTRRQVAGAAVGIAAAAFGVIALGGLGPLSISQPEPAETPAPTPIPSPTEDIVEAGDELALTVEDLEASSGAEEPVGWQVTDGAPGDPFFCAPVPGNADQIMERWFQASPDGYLHQIIEISTADTAQARFESVIDELLSCIEERSAGNPDDNWLSLIWTVDGVGDDAWLGEYAVPPRGPNDELMVVQVNVVLAGDTVTIITSGGPSMEGHNVGPLPYDVAVAAAERLCTWAGSDCIGEPMPERVFPPVQNEVEPGWLTIDDIVTAMPYFGTISEAGGIFDGEDYGHICMEPANAVAAGATAVPRRQYTDPLDEALEITFFEYIAQFESDQAARAHYDDLASAVEACGAQQRGTIAGSGHEGVGWVTEDEFAPFHLGLVINGSHVAVIVLGEPSSAQDELPPDQTLELLSRAGIRLGELD